MPSPPRVGFPTGSVSWSDGTAFTGIALVELAPPANYTSVGIGGTVPLETVPLSIPVPIQSGTFVPNNGLIYNADLSCTNTAYRYYLYDIANPSTAVAGPSSNFTVSSSTFSFPALTATPPGPGTFPTPDS